MHTAESRSIISLIKDTLSDVLRRLTVWLLTLGPVPAHVCIVPDGHRRFSRATGTDLRQAYDIGKRNVSLVSDWCFFASTVVFSVFPYSLHNLARNSFEKMAILDKVKDACEYIMNNLDEHRKMGLRTEMIGDLELLPHDVGAIMSRVEIATSSHTTKCSKVCIAYSTKHQMTHMVLRLAKAVKEGVLRGEDITTEFLEDFIKLTESCDVELLLRTSGIERFSDLLVLQSGYAYFHKEHRKFPELCFRHWVAAMLHFQLRWPRIQAVKQRHGRLVDKSGSRLNAEQAMRQQTFLRRLHAARTPYLERLAVVNKAAPLD